MGIHDGHREKVRQRFLNGGLESFADHEALELLLFYAIPRRNTNETAHLLMERYGSLSAVLSAPVEDLQNVPGVGEHAAVLLKLVPQLCRKARLADAGQDVVLNSSEKAGNYLLECFAGEQNEVIYQLCLDRKGKLLACKRLTEGGVASADLNIRQLVSNALLIGASAVILSHNHPSGIALPSSDDYVTTERARQALATIGVELADHIIVADGDFVSLSDSGYFSR
jgi:DNA repair protein RadC